MFPLLIIFFLITFFLIVCKNKNEKIKWNCRKKIDVGHSMGPCRTNNSSLSCFEPKKGTNICSTMHICTRLSFIKIFFQNSIITALHLFTVQLLEPGHLEEDHLIKTFFEKKKFWSFFCQRTNKIQGSTLYNRWTYLTSQEMALKIH